MKKSSSNLVLTSEEKKLVPKVSERVTKEVKDNDLTNSSHSLDSLSDKDSSVDKKKQA